MNHVLWTPDNVADPRSGAEKYIGAIAEHYDAKREASEKWIAEQAIIESMLDGLPAGAWVLDIPVGTGRFLKAYVDRKYQVWALDKSQDMLNQAMARAPSGPDLRRIRFALADVRDLSAMQDKSVDLSVMCRLTRWLSPEDCGKAMHELARVTRKRIIFTARVRNHPHARPLELFAVPGWKIARDEAGYEPDYRIVAMEPER